MPKYDVYGLGNALVDMVFTVDDAFLRRMQIDKGRMTLIDRTRHDALMEHLTAGTRECGGSAANALVTLSHLGGRGFYSCRVANDESGHFYLDALKAAGLDTNLSHEHLKEGVTGKCLVMVTPDAERTFNTYLGASDGFSIEELDTAAIASSAHLYIEGYLVAQQSGQPAAVEAARVARAHSVKTSLTFSDVNMITHFRAGLDEIIGPGLDLIFCNEGEALAYARTDDLAEACELLKRVARAFAITRGEHGSLVFDGTRFVEIVPQKVKAVDTVGAGDTFAGSFLYALACGRSMAQAGELANHAAAQVVTKYGPRLAKKDLQDIKRKFSLKGA